MKKIFIGFMVLICILGGAVGVMKWMELGPFANPTSAVDKPRPKNKGDAKFVEMTPLLINVFGNGKVLGNFQFELKLETWGSDNYDEVRKMSPILKDAFFKDLHTFIPRMLKEQEQLNLAVLQQRLQQRADIVMGKHVVESVLIQSVVDTPQK
jgi:flagellar basal body-associated protein FliL